MQAKQMRDRPSRLPEPRRFALSLSVKSERGLAPYELADLLGSFWIEPVRCREVLIEEMKSFLSERFRTGDGAVSDRALWTYVRYYLTNYDEIRAAVKATVGESELYDNVKVYLCCRIIREYGLEVDPLYAAFGDARNYGAVPDRFVVENLEAAASQFILQEFLKGPAHSGRKIRGTGGGLAVGEGQRLGGGRAVDKRQRAAD